MNKLLIVRNIEQAAVLDVGDSAILHRMILPYHKGKLDKLNVRKAYLERLITYCAESYMLCSLLQKAPEDIDILTSSYGKPFLKGEPAYFSISHSFPYAAVAVSDVPIGVDVENIRPFNETACRRLFSEGEVKTINDVLTDLERDSIYTRIWTKKEAYAKALGSGMTWDMKTVDTVSLDGKYLFFTHELKERESRAGYVTVCMERDASFSEKEKPDIEIIPLEVLVLRLKRCIDGYQDGRQVN